MQTLQYSEEFAKNSYERFYKAETLEEFLNLYKLFYTNQIVTPNYLSLFVNFDGDCPEASPYLGSLFSQITNYGIICDDSQVNISGSQKGCISFIAPVDAMEKIHSEINKYNNIVMSYNAAVNNNTYEIVGPCVTYDDPIERRATDKYSINNMEGRAHSSYADNFELRFRSPNVTFSNKLGAIWLSENIEKLLSAYARGIIICADFHKPATYPMEILLEVCKNHLTKII